MPLLDELLLYLPNERHRPTESERAEPKEVADKIENADSAAGCP